MDQKVGDHLNQLFKSRHISHRFLKSFDDVSFAVEEMSGTNSSSSSSSSNDKNSIPIKVGWLFFHRHDKSVNILDRDLMNKLKSILDMVEEECLSPKMEQQPMIHAIVLYSLNRGFIIGADVNMIYSICDPLDAQKLSNEGHNLLFRLERLDIPTVAAIHGNCLGGGLEVALACSHRVSSDDRSTNLGLPEIKLGIIPGLGGTVRLPRMIGLSAATQLILAGSTVNAHKAKKLGIIDEIFNYNDSNNDNNNEQSFFHKVRQYAINLVKSKSKIVDKYWRRSIPIKEIIMERNQYGRRIFEYKIRKLIDKLAKGKYPAPYIALETVIQTYSAATLRQAAKIESEQFGRIVCTNEAKYFINLFQIMEETKKIEKICSPSKIPTIKKVGIIGTGIMGSALAQLSAYKNYNVYIKGIDEQSVQNGLKRVDSLFNNLVKRERIMEQEKEQYMKNIAAGTDFNELAKSDLIIDAALAGEETINRILSIIETSNPNAIFATNACSVTVGTIASASHNKQNVLGMQFLNPVYRVPIVEIVKTDFTAPEVVGAGYQFALNLGKTPIVVNDSPGFLLTRLYAVYCLQAINLVIHGWSFDFIDKLMESFGFQMGPFQVMDQSGLDVCLKIFPAISQQWSEMSESLEKLNTLVYKEGNLGKKVNKGFYLYNKSGKIIGPNPVATKLFGRRSRIQIPNITNEKIIDSCILCVVNEATKCLEADIVSSASHIDLATTLGLGFPPFRGGGLLGYCDQRGMADIVQNMNELREVFNFDILRPSDMIVRMASTHEKFFPNRIILNNSISIPKPKPLISFWFPIILVSILVFITGAIVYML